MKALRIFLEWFITLHIAPGILLVMTFGSENMETAYILGWFINIFGFVLYLLVILFKYIFKKMGIIEDD